MDTDTTKFIIWKDACYGCRLWAVASDVAMSRAEYLQYVPTLGISQNMEDKAFKMQLCKFIYKNDLWKLKQNSVNPRRVVLSTESATTVHQ